MPSQFRLRDGNPDLRFQSEDDTTTQKGLIRKCGRITSVTTKTSKWHFTGGGGAILSILCDFWTLFSPTRPSFATQISPYTLGRGRSRIPRRRGTNAPRGGGERQHIILPNVEKNYMKLRKFWAIGGRPPKSATAGFA